MIFAFRVVDFWKKTLFRIMLWYFQQTHCLGEKKINNCFFLFFQLILQEDKKQVSNEEIKYETPQLFFLNVNSMIIMRSWSILKYFSFGMHEDEVGVWTLISFKYCHWYFIRAFCFFHSHTDLMNPI